MAHTLKISDGTTTADFLGSNYKVLTDGGWSPRRAQRRRGLLGGSPYEDVIETMYIQVKSTTAADALDKLETLSELLDQAEAWGQGENVTAVYIEYEAPGTDAGASVKAVIMGPPPGGDYFTMPHDFGGVKLSSGFAIGTNNDPIRLQFLRRGLWLNSTGQTKAASATTGNPAIATTASFTNTMSIPVPYDIDMSFSGTIVPGAGGEFELMALTTNAANKLFFVEAESMTGGSSTANTNASNGNVHQAADSSTTTLSTSLSFPAGSNKFAFFVVVQPSGTTTNWNIQARLFYHATHNDTWQFGRKYDVPNVNDEYIISLGVIETNFNPARLFLYFTPDANNGENLKIDYVCGMVIDDSSNIISTNTSTTSMAAGDQIEVLQNIFGTGRPQVELSEASSPVAILNYGGSSMPYASGSVISSLVFGMSSSRYILYDSDGAQEANLTFSATRYDGYLTPP